MEILPGLESFQHLGGKGCGKGGMYLRKYFIERWFYSLH